MTRRRYLFPLFLLGALAILVRTDAQAAELTFISFGSLQGEIEECG